MALFTFIMDFQGGTYISQVNATSPESACIKWAENLETSEIPGLGSKGKNFIIEEVKKEPPVTLKGVSNSWCTILDVYGKRALINLVQTEQTPV
jgi:hypothetical protein